MLHLLFWIKNLSCTKSASLHNSNQKKVVPIWRVCFQSWLNQKVASYINMAAIMTNGRLPLGVNNRKGELSPASVWFTLGQNEFGSFWKANQVSKHFPLPTIPGCRMSRIFQTFNLKNNQEKTMNKLGHEKSEEHVKVQHSIHVYP